MANLSLHTALVRAPGATPTRALLFLHGILGSGTNLRGLAQSFVQADETLAAVLVDLRLHGRSRAPLPPHDVPACARDLEALASSLAWPVAGVVGHSFGGKVALAYHAAHPDLERLVILDSGLGARPDRAGSEETMSVLAMLERLPTHYDKREAFVARVQSEGHGRGIADWLAMNLERTPHGFTLRLDAAGIRALLDSYFSLDLWPVLERSTASRIDLVIGGRSRVWDDADRARADSLAATKPNLHVHLLPEAGHWVHVDSPDALRAALAIEPRAQSNGSTP